MLSHSGFAAALLAGSRKKEMESASDSAAGVETAVDYSGAGEGRPLPMVIQTRASSIDRGACIMDLSLYPGEMTLGSLVCTGAGG